MQVFSNCEVSKSNAPDMASDFHRYVNLAALPDWFDTLWQTIQALPESELEYVRQRAEVELRPYQFCVFGGQRHLNKIYLSRVRQLSRRRLQTLQDY